MKQIEHGIQFAGVQTTAERPDIVGKIGFSEPSDDRAFQVPDGEHARHAEDDDPVARR